MSIKEAKHGYATSIKIARIYDSENYPPESLSAQSISTKGSVRP